MSSFALAAPLKLTPAQLDTIAAGQGLQTGFEDITGQGNLENQNAQGGPNAGTAEVSGPPGQINQGNTDCNNCTVDLPGANR
jgi:hypothetical protein